MLQTEELQRIAEWIPARSTIGDNRLIVLGDWNLTPWSSQYRRFLDETQLKQSGPALFASTTWPASCFVPFGLPIDLVAAEPGPDPFRVESLPAIGSDHLPILVEVRIAPR